MKRFEHRVDYFVDWKDVKGALKEYGEAGWELVCVDPSQMGSKSFTLFLKRELTGTAAWTDMRKSLKKSKTG